MSQPYLIGSFELQMDDASIEELGYHVPMADTCRQFVITENFGSRDSLAGFWTASFLVMPEEDFTLAQAESALVELRSGFEFALPEHAFTYKQQHTYYPGWFVVLGKTCSVFLTNWMIECVLKWDRFGGSPRFMLDAANGVWSKKTRRILVVKRAE